MQIEKSANKVAATDSAVDKLNSFIKSSSESGKNVLLLLSGGSSLELLDRIETGYLNRNFTISVLDERYSRESDENNFAQIAKTEFYGKSQKRNCRFIDTRIMDGETQKMLAERFNSELKGWFDNNPDSTVIATVGVGPDGHTSGIMPFPEDPKKFKELFDNEGVFAVGYDATGKNPYANRVTTTFPLLRRVNNGVIYATGENKKDALAKLLSPSGSLAETPSRIWVENKGEIYLFTDASN
jgi:6-phosphogluconolactonase/glucosamine-6-phosphate isomerase/deaminase